MPDGEKHNMTEAGTLYIVATPIGNLGDITERAQEVLKAADFVMCEDTRIGGKLLTLLNIKKPLISYYEHNKNIRHQALLARLNAGESGALITDAGTPCISDPGTELVALAHEAGLKVVPVPGACAAITAISASGIDCRRYVFEGFLEKNRSTRLKRLQELSGEARPVVFYLAAHEYLDAIKDIYNAFGNRRVSLGRELTKLNEQIVTGELETLLATEITLKGEFVLITEGYAGNSDSFWNDMTITEHVDAYIRLGNSKMDAMKLVAADRKLSKSDVYKEFLNNEG